LGANFLVLLSPFMLDSPDSSIKAALKPIQLGYSRRLPTAMATPPVTVTSPHRLTPIWKVTLHTLLTATLAGIPRQTFCHDTEAVNR
jgi:hypothetical protein